MKLKPQTCIWVDVNVTLPVKKKQYFVSDGEGCFATAYFSVMEEEFFGLGLMFTPKYWMEIPELK